MRFTLIPFVVSCFGILKLLTPYFQTKLKDRIFNQFKMKRGLILLAVVAFACAMHLHDSQHALRKTGNEHELILRIHDAGQRDYGAIKEQFLAQFPPGPTVDGQKAYDIANFFATPMGSTILSYFESIASPSLNTYNLSPQNYRLWMAIKILSKGDNNLYGRSLTADYNLFKEFVDKSYERQGR